MDALIQLLLLCLCACALCEPLGAALHRHSRHGVYARDYSRDYEPYVFAAIPLHAPVPVLRVLSPVPLGARHRKHAPSVQHPGYTRVPDADDEYVSATHAAYEDAAYEPQQYASSQYAASPYLSQYQASQLYAAASSAPEEPTILYARPSASGGYTYHTSPKKSSSKRAPPGAADAPYIIRVHKYRVVKER